ncbi:MAG: hypothetical protein A3H35_14560 [Betaproteobacteria bacterium RIFCSPLOWO2_02_FULL_62_17]|nr:MAG: hypothetical protein A3H35_14560 [Betaproteobacteria bacterium RIFCSPLOWO2_02_FULL_62_17]
MLEGRFRSEVLALHVREKEISEALAQRISAWRHTGFSVHNGVKALRRGFKHGIAARRQAPQTWRPD